MDSLNVAEIENGKKFSGNLYLDQNFILLPANVPFPGHLKSVLTEWGFREIFAKETEKPKAQVKSVSLGAFESVNLDDVLEEKRDQKEEKGNFLQGANKILKESVEKEMQALSKMNVKDIDNQMAAVRRIYDAFHEYVMKTYTRYVTHRELKIGLISEAVQILCDVTASYRKFVLRIQPRPDEKSDKNFIISHSLRSTIFAVVIGQNLKMATTKLIDLGVASILHEIGQIRLPPQLYLSDRRLLPAERKLLATHTILSSNILKENNFPPAIQLGVLEHHERENGKGYPRGVTGDKISLYGKILSVVCSYEAISAPRHYKEAKTTHEAMIEMLRNADKQYDDTVIKALLQSVSLFPIGGYVYLANGKVAQVIDANRLNPKTPIVQLVGEKGADGFPVVVQTDGGNLRVVRVLNSSEISGIK